MSAILHSPVLMGLIGMVAPVVAIYLWNLLLPRERVYDFGYRLMSALMAFTFEKVGESGGRKLIDRIENTLTDLTTGMRDATLGRYQGMQNAKCRMQNEE